MGICPLHTITSSELHSDAAWSRVLESVLSCLGIVTLVLDEQGTVEQATPSLESILGESVVGKRLNAYLVPESVLSFHNALSSCLREGRCKQLGLTFRGWNGPLWTSTRVIPIASEEKPRVFVIIQNQTEFQELLRKNLLHGALHELYAHHVRELIAIVDADGNFAYVSPSFKTVLDYEEHTLRGKWFLAPIASHDRERAKEAFLTALQQKQPCRVELRLCNRSGSTKWFEVDFIPSDMPRFYQGCVYFIGRDITHRKRYEDYLERLAFQDPLTGLPNRRAVKREITERIRRGERFAVGYFDLNAFKDVNDAYGHEVGDRFLRAFVETVQKRLPSTVVMARLGGDEFVLVIPDEHRACIPQLPDILTVRVTLEGGLEIVGAACVGIAWFPDDGTEAESLLRKADVALYVAKERSQRICYYGALRLHVERFKVEFPRAMERGELFLMYRPEVDLQTETVIGLEALTRWEHPEFGILTPAEFLPLVEKAGWTAPFTRWVLARVMEDWKRLRREGVSIAINVPPKLIENGCILKLLTDAVRDWPKGFRLEIEITEEDLLSEWETAAQVLAELRRRGIMVVLDDFGSGYATLSYLLETDLDKLKVDRLFLQDMPGDRKRHVILEQMLQMAERLNIHTIAEGVETEGQHAYLRRLGFHYGQGFYYGKPMRIDEVLQRLASSTANDEIE